MFARSWWICLLWPSGCFCLTPRNQALGFMTRSSGHLLAALPLSTLSLTAATVLVPLHTRLLVPPLIVSWPLGGGLVGTRSSRTIWRGPWLPPLLWWISMAGSLAPLLLSRLRLLPRLCRPFHRLLSLRPCLLSLLAVSASVGSVDVVALLLWAPLLLVFLCCFFFPNFLFGGV